MTQTIAGSAEKTLRRIVPVDSNLAFARGPGKNVAARSDPHIYLKGTYGSFRLILRIGMPELQFDHPVPELTEEPDAQTLDTIAEGHAQLDAGQGIPIDELRAELARRCSK